MQGKSGGGGNAQADPDDAPELGDEFFEKAELRVGGRVVRPARGGLTGVALALDTDVGHGLQASGPGWEQRANAALRQYLAGSERR